MDFQTIQQEPPIRQATSLRINVSTLLQEPIGAVREFEIADARADGLAEHVNGTLRLLRTDQTVMATASLSTVLTDICGACLEDVVLTLQLEFDEEFWPPMDFASGARTDPPPERFGFSVTDGEIDLSEAVRQYVELERPMSPRCRADCPGLGSDEPDEEPIDDRWAPLAALKRTMESEGD